jgi:DNA transposition AAA+ family ATPase
MALSTIERAELARASVPGTAETLAAVREHMQLADLSIAEFAERIGYGKSSVQHFLYGSYRRIASTDKNLRRAAWDYMQRKPLRSRARANGRLFETGNYKTILRYVLAAIDSGEVSLLYGPPGTQKTFALEHIVAERNRAGKNDAIYIYSSEQMTPLWLLKRIGREAGVRVGFAVRDRILSNLLANFATRPRPPAVIADEAQHLPVAALEVLRELHDRSGCGLVLAGSHNLYQNFLRGRQYLEQWLSRIDHKDPLPGLSEDEVRGIAARELGNGHPAKLSEKQATALVHACQVDDIFARGSEGKPAPKKYLSVRRLVKVLAQHKSKKKAAA